MASQKIEQGPTGRRVARNIRHFRTARNLSTYALSQRLEKIGHRLLPSGITRIERGERLVDPDDLAALALALDVTPNALLLPLQADEAKIGVTPLVEATGTKAWTWATGEKAGRDLWRQDKVGLDLDREERFVRENRPHAPLPRFTIDDVQAHREQLLPLYEALLGALSAGIPPVEILGYVDLATTMEEAVRTFGDAVTKRGAREESA